ncbi:hypothetical protein BpHYR1_034732 [Brachionus plicatilis]|uniref:Uncharacterized protein n=1 Tax=Brachionus plicatilis TaxID=10195 RepID=A0A3M7Q3Z4_BRAPC|nr:hypothetical protein BpHYR1_034732 [Brachionus plicatilis]
MIMKFIIFNFSRYLTQSRSRDALTVHLVYKNDNKIFDQISFFKFDQNISKCLYFEIFEKFFFLQIKD